MTRGSLNDDNLPDCTTVDIHDDLQAHANSEDGYLAGEILDGVPGDARVGLRVPWARRDDEMVQLEERETGGADGVVAGDRDLCAAEEKLLVEIPGERVEIVDHEDIEMNLEMRGELLLAGGHGGGTGKKDGKEEDGWTSKLYRGFQSAQPIRCRRSR